MSRLVMKFGGSLVGSPAGIRRVADLVATSRGRGAQVVVVVSALGDVTDLLLRTARVAQGEDERGIERSIRGLRDIHLAALRGTGMKEPERRKVAREIETKLEMLQQTLRGVSLLGELSPRSKDIVVSFGERLSAPIVAAELQHRGIAAPSMTGGEAGVVTDGSYGEATPILSKTNRAVRRSLLPLLSEGKVPVVAGFIARSDKGDITTLGRGGSDFTATLLASSLGADEVWIWTDVDGIRTADPKVVRASSLLAELSYAEAEELAFFGAKNMHPLALGPARFSHIPVRIKNGFKPELPGTLITDRQTKSRGVVKAVAVVRGVGLLSVSGETLQGRPGTAAKVLSALATAGVNVLMISQSVSEANIGMVVKQGSLDAAASALKHELKKDRLEVGVETDPKVAVVAAVGAGMRGAKGVAAKVFKAVADAGVNVRMIAQGSSELNISFVVDRKDADTAVRALHEQVIRTASQRGTT